MAKAITVMNRAPYGDGQPKDWTEDDKKAAILWVSQNRTLSQIRTRQNIINSQILTVCRRIEKGQDVVAMRQALENLRVMEDVETNAVLLQQF